MRTAEFDWEFRAPQRVLDVTGETGQADHVRAPIGPDRSSGGVRLAPRPRQLDAARRWVSRAVLALFVAAVAACAKPGTPEEVADAFADAYFRQMDQEKAKKFTALGASAMLDEELRSVAEIRKEGYSPGDDGARVNVQRGESSRREQRVRVPYQVEIESEGAKTVKDADVELTQIQGSWKVVRVGLRSRP